jgi:hypothetical protein
MSHTSTADELMTRCPDDRQRGLKHVARFLSFKPYVLLAETNLNKVALKTEINVSVKPTQ